MSAWLLIGVVVGIALYWLLRIAVDDLVWRLRGRPGAGYIEKPPMRLANLRRNLPGMTRRT